MITARILALVAGVVGIAVYAGEGGAATAGVEAARAAAPLAPSRHSGTPALRAGRTLARGLQVPWGLAFLPGGDALISERGTGRILRLNPRSGGFQEVYRVPGVTPLPEGGLLGIAISPRFARDRMVYAYFTATRDSRIVRFRLGSRARPKVVLAGITRGPFHNGGRIAFGPDGMLYASVGDGGARERAQDLTSLNGKILRLTPVGRPAPGNPFAGSLVYSLGHRNVEGLGWDSQGRLFASEFGENTADEINLIRPGGNYGWPVLEGTGDTQGGRYTNPLRTWPPSEASPAGIAIAHDVIYMASLRGQRLWMIPITGNTLGTPTAHLQGRYGRLRTAQIARDGSLWLTTSNTDILGQPRAGDDRVLRFPAR